jgi:hypothetical protein
VALIPSPILSTFPLRKVAELFMKVILNSRIQLHWGEKGDETDGFWLVGHQSERRESNLCLGTINGFSRKSCCSSPHLYVGLLNVKGMIQSFFTMKRIRMKVVYSVDNSKQVFVRVFETISQ